MVLIVWRAIIPLVRLIIMSRNRITSRTLLRVGGYRRRVTGDGFVCGWVRRSRCRDKKGGGLRGPVGHAHIRVAT